MPSLSSETAVQRGKIAAPPIVEPAELDPVFLFEVARENFGWSREQFSVAFGCELYTLYRWMQKRRNSCKLARIHAANLYRLWGFN